MYAEGKLSSCPRSDDGGKRSEPPTCGVPSSEWQVEVYFVATSAEEGIFSVKVIPPPGNRTDDFVDREAWPPVDGERVIVPVVYEAQPSASSAAVEVGGLGSKGVIGGITVKNNSGNVNSNNRKQTGGGVRINNVNGGKIGNITCITNSNNTYHA